MKWIKKIRMKMINNNNNKIKVWMIAKNHKILINNYKILTKIIWL